MTATEQLRSRLDPTERTRRVWNAADLANRSSWRYQLPARVADEFFALCRRDGAAKDDKDFEFERAAQPALCRFADQVRPNLHSGDGVALVRGLDRLGLTDEQRRIFYLAFGSALGRPMTEYGKLYAVLDRGGSHLEQSIPVSQTNAATDFHTDSSRLDCVPDIVGLLCEQPAKVGGDSLVSNGLNAHAILREQAPDALSLLQQDLIRDLVTPGCEKNHDSLLRNRFPVFAPSDAHEGVGIRYMRYWIERGQERAGQPLDADQLAALDLLDSILESPENFVSFKLEAGDILWVNNRTVTHNRSSYVNDPEHPRCLQRMWIDASTGTLATHKSVCP